MQPLTLMFYLVFCRTKAENRLNSHYERQQLKLTPDPLISN